MDELRLSRRQLAFMLGVPVAWGILLLFHPGGEGDQIYLDLHDKVTVWMVVHVGMLIFIPLFALAVYQLVRELEGTAARVCVVALWFFAIFYGAFETIQGIGVGILVDEVNGREAIDQATREELVQDFAENPLVTNLGVFGAIGGVALVTAMVTAGVALRSRAGAPLSVPILLGISGFLIGAHPPPYGPIGLACFVAAVLLLVRSQSTVPAAAEIPPSQPAAP